MKKILFIAFMLVSLVGLCQSPSFVERSGPAITAQDWRLAAKLNFYLPHTHGLTLNGGLDTLGAMIYEDSSYHIWIRDTLSVSPFGHKWSMILKTGDAGIGTVYQVVSGYGLLPGTITTTGTISLDSATMSQYWIRRKDSLVSYVTPREMFSQGYITGIAGIPAGGSLTGTYPDPTIAVNAVALVNMTQLPAFSFIGNPAATTATPQASYFKYGLIWQNDSVKVDTATLKAVFGQSAAAGITQLTGDGIAGPGSGSQAFTLNTVNGTPVGSVSFIKIAANGKGLVTGTTSVVSGDITGVLGFTPISLTSISASSPISYNNTTGVISCPTCGISSGGITTLNGLTAANQTFAIGYTGTSFNVVSNSSTHTFNIPIGSSVDTGLVTPAMIATWNGKANLTSLSATTPLTYNNTTGVFAIQQGNTSQNGYITATDWNTFNGKMANPMTAAWQVIYGGTGGIPTALAAPSTSGYVITWNGSAIVWAPGGGGSVTPDTVRVKAYGTGKPIISTNTAGDTLYHRTFENTATVGWGLNSDSSIYAYSLLVGVNSVNISGANVNLVNDVTSPGVWYMYSTNGSGARGWNAFTSGPLATSITPGLLSASGYVLLNFQQTILNSPVGYSADSVGSASVTQDTLYLARMAVRSGSSFFSVDSTSQSNVNINTWVINMPNQTANTLLGYNNSGVASIITAGTGISIASGVISSTGGGSGVTSVAMTVPTSFITVAGSPITSTGTFAVSLTNASAHTYWGNNTGSSAAASYLTNVQVTADLDLFTTSLQGLVPASGGGTTNFLRADGTWAAPSGGGGTPGGSDKQIQFNDAGAFTGNANFLYNYSKNGVVVISPGIGTTSLDSNGLILATGTAAASGSQQYSQIFEQVANGYATTPAASQPVAFRWQVQTVQGAAAPTANYILTSMINNGSPTTIVTIPTGGGTVAFASPVTSTANIGVGATAAFFFGSGSTQAAMYGTDSTYLISFRNTTHPVGVRVLNTYTAANNQGFFEESWQRASNVYTMGTYSYGAAPAATVNLIGTWAAVTQTAGDNSTKLATTAYVNNNAYSGTYSATITPVSNSTSPSSGVGHYIRVANQVTVDIPIVVNLTVSAVATEYYVSLPVSSTISLGSDLTGMGTSTDPLTSGLGITGNTTNHVADVTFTATGTGANNMYLHFSYTVD